MFRKRHDGYDKGKRLDKEGSKNNYKVLSHGLPIINLFSLQELEEKAILYPMTLIHQFFGLKLLFSNNIFYFLVEMEIEEFVELLKFASKHNSYAKGEIKKTLFNIFKSNYTSTKILYLLIKHDFTQFLEKNCYEILYRNQNDFFIKNLKKLLYQNDFSTKKDITFTVNNFLFKTFNREPSDVLNGDLKSEIKACAEVSRIVNLLETRDLKRIFKIWEKEYLYKLEKEDLINLFKEYGAELIEGILRSLHFIAYEQRKQFDSELEIIPVEYKKKDIIRGYIIQIIKKQDLTSLVPLLSAYFFHYLEPNDIQMLINDEESGFFKNTIWILGDYHDELYYYNDEFYIGHLEFFKICKLIDKNRLKSLLLTVITNDSVSNYGPIIEEGLIRKFTPFELIEILEHLDINRLKAFLISITQAVRYFEEFDGYESKKAFRYVINLESYLSKSIKKSIVTIIKESEPEPEYMVDGKLIRKTWFLPLNLGKLGWFRHLALSQLEELLVIIKEKYREKSIEIWDKREFRIVITNIKRSIKNFYEKPIEGISLTKVQLREFLNRLAGDEGCQFNRSEWRCGGKEFVYAIKILDKMKITQKEQELLLDRCTEYDGHCDCEILMNAAQMLLNEETPW
ncbi:hypothetical protein LCGC14_1101380 [marine sediment metagenome]|uniref:DUF2695 domain-containing protein n=1 Tax=marine sediment metagenome TaxID=412755 RepID=A0A0F9M9D2_9ZZZZ|nr:MAG: hypothetical protein Lokiarch_31660 [Candidatus Lokiarchaeum sp. GC14_75]